MFEPRNRELERSRIDQRAKERDEAERLTLARQIRAAGIPIFIAEDDVPTSGSWSDLLVYQTGGVVDSTVFDLQGGTGLILYLTITFGVPRFAVANFELELPWPTKMELLADPFESAAQPRVYRFGGEHGIDFERQRVLNHRASVRHLYRRGESLEGCLLAIGNERIPDSLEHGKMVSAHLIIYDQFLRAYKSDVSLWTDRSGKDSRSNTTRPGRLFENPDPPSHHARMNQYRSRP